MEERTKISVFCQRCMGMFSFRAGGAKIPSICPTCVAGLPARPALAQAA